MKPTPEELARLKQDAERSAADPGGPEWRMFPDDVVLRLLDYVERLEAALTEIMKVVGTSTLQYHIARAALEGDNG